MVALSFISTLPSVIPLIQSIPATAILPIHHYRTITCKVEADPEMSIAPRDATFYIVLELPLEWIHNIAWIPHAAIQEIVEWPDLIGRSSSFIEVANAADLNQRRQRSEFQSKIKTTLSIALKGNPDLLPSVLTLSLNDAVTYDKATKSGGPNGSIRFSSEINRPENKGLSGALNLLEEVKKEVDSYSKGGPIAYADLIHFAAQSAVKSTFLAAAIRKCGGNEEKGALLYSAYGSNGQWGLFDRQFGRSDAQEPDLEGRVPVPQWEKSSVQEMKDKFSSIGFGPRQLAVMSAFLGPDQSATESLLASDPEVLPWVQKYQRSRETVSQTDYEVDLITTLTKIVFLRPTNQL